MSRSERIRNVVWQKDAACQDYNPDLWFDELSKRKAKHVCRTECPVRLPCLLYALAQNEPYGVWGGMTAKERRRLTRGRSYDSSERFGHDISSVTEG